MIRIQKCAFALAAIVTVGAMGAIDAATAFANARGGRPTVVRDHRGPNGAPQGGVTVGGRPTRVTTAPKILGRVCHTARGFECLRNTGEKGNPGGRGVTIRDHR